MRSSSSIPSSSTGSGGAVSHIAGGNILETVDEEVITAVDSWTELHLNCFREDTTAVSGEVRRAGCNIDRAWSCSCINKNTLTVTVFYRKTGKGKP